MTPSSGTSGAGGGGGGGGDLNNLDDPSTLRGRQLAALRQMLRLNPTGGDSPQWKVLLFDRLGQDLLSPVLNVKALRDEGVTLHLLINTER